MFLGVADGHLCFQDSQELVRHVVSAEPDGGDHGRHLWHLELPADIVFSLSLLRHLLFLITNRSTKELKAYIYHEFSYQ